jgi:uncharacterized protein YqhQ
MVDIIINYMIISIKSLTFSRNRIYQASSKSDKFKKKTKQNKIKTTFLNTNIYVCVCVCLQQISLKPVKQKTKRRKKPFFLSPRRLVEQLAWAAGSSDK